MTLDLTKPNKKYWEDRNKSIERQTACKCVAKVFQGQGSMADETALKRTFLIFMKFIREEV